MESLGVCRDGSPFLDRANVERHMCDSLNCVRLVVAERYENEQNRGR